LAVPERALRWQRTLCHTAWPKSGTSGTASPEATESPIDTISQSCALSGWVCV
jgi:hypothetical protein